MPVKKISELPIGTPSDDDVIPFVDNADNTTKKATRADLKGDTGDAATLDVGTTTTGDAGTDASVTNSGTTSAAVFDFTIPRGNTGSQGVQGNAGADGLDINWLGAYSGATTYAVNDAVSYNGSSYICKLISTNNVPTNGTYWDLMAQKGTDGSGTGDMLASTYDPTGRATDIFTLLDSKEIFHGIQSAGTLSFDNGTHVLSLSSVTYWNRGSKYTTASATTCDLDLTADRDNSSGTLTADTIYFFYFKDNTGKLYWSDTPWNFETDTFVATVYWNGTAGALMKETHTYNRDLAWHKWAHLTVGTRYGAGLELVLPSVATDNSLQINSGTIYDEDITLTIGQQTTMRAFYKTDSTNWTFADFAFPYTGTSGAPTFLDTDTYALSTFATNDFVCYWVYASNDIDRPIWIVPTHQAAAHTTITLARAETTPDLSLLPANAEMKLIYRFIFKGDGQFQESADYRLSSSLPSGGSPSTTAGAVSYTPGGTISATTVQTAIEELDTEKIAVSAIDTDLSSTSASDDTVPSAKATKAMGDLKLALAGGTMTGNITLGENTSIALDPAGSADGKYTGITISGTAGATLAFGDVIVLDVTASKWLLADANSAAAADGDARGLIGICVLAANDTQTTTILLNGVIRADTAFPALTITNPVYLSETAGDLTSTQPTTADVVIRTLGFALTADEIYFNPEPGFITHT